MRRRRLWIVFLAASALGLLSPAFAQGDGWSTPIDLSDAGPDSPYVPVAWFPSMAVDGDGTVHVTWYGSMLQDNNIEDSIDLLMYRSRRGGVWSPPVDVVYASNGGFTVRNTIVAGRDRKIHAVLRTTTNMSYARAPWESAGAAGAWSSPQPIADGSYYNALATDSKGALFAFWTGRESELYYRRSRDGGASWSDLVNISNMPDGEDRPQVQVDLNDRIHLVWGHGYDWYGGLGKPESAVYRRSEDGGINWTAPRMFTLPELSISQPALGVTNEGNPLIVYRTMEDSRMYFEYSPDGGDTWRATGEIPGVAARAINDPPLDSYSLATDSANRVHLLMVGFLLGREQVDPELLHLMWDGQAWSAPRVVMSKPFLRPEWPRIEISEGRQLHAVWFTRNRLYEEDRSVPDRQVWYSSLQVDAPARPPLPAFTPVPTAAPALAPAIATAAPEPTPTISAAARSAPLPGGPPAWERNSLRTISLAVLPLGLVLLGIIIIKLRSR